MLMDQPQVSGLLVELSCCLQTQILKQHFLFQKKNSSGMDLPDAYSLRRTILGPGEVALDIVLSIQPYDSGVR